MPNSNENTPTRINKVIAFIDYVPAELKKGEDWIIRYYCKNPFTQKLERFRLRAPKNSNTRNRELHAKKIVAEINRKLGEGWTPFLEKPGNGFKTFTEATESYIQLIYKEQKDGIKREDTIRSYESMIRLIHLYIKEKKVKIIFAAQFDKQFVANYLDWIYFDRNNSPRTFNNHLLFCKTFSRFLIGRGYIKEDPTTSLKNKPKGQKIRVVIEEKYKAVIREFLPIHNKEYFVLCMIPYYCMVRRTEITKLRRYHFDLEADIINLPGELSKNGKDESTTIPFEFKSMLIEHFRNSESGDYAFSGNGFAPGAEQLKPKKISDTWTKFRKNHSLPDNIHWYSLKDTGITDLFESGAISSLKIRDQARHKDLKTTELYTNRTAAGDIMIKNSGIKF